MPITLPMVKPRMLKHRLPPGKSGSWWSIPNARGRQKCLKCGGQGETRGKACTNCGGRGRRKAEVFT